RELVARLTTAAAASGDPHHQKPVEVWLGLADPLMQRAPLTFAGDLFRRVLDLRDDEPLARRREKILAAVATTSIASAPFLGEIAGCPFEDKDDPTLRAARRSPELLAAQVDDAVIALVSARVEHEHRLLIILEDVHWADAVSLRLFATLFSRLR